MKRRGTLLLIVALALGLSPRPVHAQAQISCRFVVEHILDARWGPIYTGVIRVTPPPGALDLAFANIFAVVDPVFPETEEYQEVVEGLTFTRLPSGDFQSSGLSYIARPETHMRGDFSFRMRFGIGLGLFLDQGCFPVITLDTISAP